MGANILRRSTFEAESEARLMLDQIVRALREQDGVHDWLVRHVQKKSTQHYVIGPRPENRRKVTSERAMVTIMNDHHPAQESHGLERGEAEIALLPTDLERLQQRLGQAVYMASLTDNPLYGLPDRSEYPAVDLVDPQMRDRPREVAARMIRELTERLATEEDVRLSSAEVFIEESSIAMENSRGARGRRVQTELLLDVVLLASHSGEEMESHAAFTRRRVADPNVPALVRRHAQYARDALVAGTPRTGSFPVIVTDDALAELLMSSGYSPLVLCSAAQLKYERISSWEVGQSILAQDQTGDPFTVHSNALLPFGTRSGSFDAEGLPGQRVLIIDNGLLSRFWAPQRYAEYLGIPATGTFGNMEIAAGSVPLGSLFDGKGPLYHIVAFSAMEPDPHTGDFVGEIRLGYEISEGRKHPVRGGSISGNLFEVLAAARLSQETVFLGDYLGPRAMRFAQVTVAGR